MQIQKIRLKNWRNFKRAEARELVDVCYILGPNASGKSNLLDALRLLRDLAKSKGGGLQAAIDDRGGLKKLRCLHARKDTDIEIEIDVADNSGVLNWSYLISFNFPGSGKRVPLVRSEQVSRIMKSGEKEIVLNRPNLSDQKDDALLRETHLEQISSNADFRNLAEFLGGITYVHLVPQLLKFGNRIGGHVIEEDPFGQAFMVRIAEVQKRTRDARLMRIEKALKAIIPHMSDLQFVQDEVTGQNHLEIRYEHHRPKGAKQREDQFSDGTLRLISLLWLLQESGESPLLLEEPELSLNEEIVAAIPELIAQVRRKIKSRRQVFITTHSQALLSNEGIDRKGVVVVEPSAEGSALTKTNGNENKALDSGFSIAHVVLPRAKKISETRQLELQL